MNDRTDVPITPYDQETLDHLRMFIRDDSNGMSLSLFERVALMAGESAYWRMRAEVAEIAAQAAQSS